MGKKQPIEPIDVINTISGPECEILEKRSKKTIVEIGEILNGDPSKMTIRVSAALSYVLRLRSEPDAKWKQHWNLPVDESLAWLSDNPPSG